jgi:hypothetical protein
MCVERGKGQPQRTYVAEAPHDDADMVPIAFNHIAHGNSIHTTAVLGTVVTVFVPAHLAGSIEQAVECRVVGVVGHTCSKSTTTSALSNHRYIRGSWRTQYALQSSEVTTYATCSNPLHARPAHEIAARAPESQHPAHQLNCGGKSRESAVAGCSV